MQFLNRFLEDERDYCQLVKHLSSGDLPLILKGLTGINKAVIASAIASGGHKLLMITDTEAAAIELKNDLLALGISAGHLPIRDYNLTRIDGYSKEYEIMRIDTLSSILDGDFAVVTASVSSATQYTVPEKILSSGIFHISHSDIIDIDELINKLLRYGYKKSNICEGAGQFSVRGGIIDIFAVGSKMPARIELYIVFGYARLSYSVYALKHTYTVHGMYYQIAVLHFVKRAYLFARLKITAFFIRCRNMLMSYNQQFFRRYLKTA